MSPSFRTVLVASVLALAGCPTEAPKNSAPKPAGLAASPRSLTYRCVTPGCDTSQDILISATGTRRLVVKRLVLSDDKRTDFTLTPETPAPFVVHDAFKLTVRYVPVGGPDPGDVTILVTYADSSSDETDPNRIPPGELQIPVYRRMVGEPELTANPTTLNFGPVAPGEKKSLDLTVGNGGYGNISLVLDKIESGSPLISPDKVPADPLLPGKNTAISVTYAPAVAGYTKTLLTLTSTDPTVPPVDVVAVGTSYSTPVAATDPETGLDFGEVPKTAAKTKQILILNQGGAALNVSSVTVSSPSGDLSASLPKGAVTATLGPLESVPLTVNLSSAHAGPINGTIVINSDDPTHPALSVPVQGLVTEPLINLAPTGKLDFGLVFKTWVVNKTVTVTNTGWGGLVVKRIGMTASSSVQFGVRQLPPVMPITLQHGEKFDFVVQFNPQAKALFTGTVAIESNDANNGFVNYPVSGEGSECPPACPLPHAVPDCTRGNCRVDSCEAGFFDLDGNYDNGCECAALALPVPGDGCSTAVDLGVMADGDWSYNSYSNNLALMQDPQSGASIPAVHWFHFWAPDISQYFWQGDYYDVRVRLTTSDPNIQLCVYRTPGSGPQGCSMASPSCYAPGSAYYEYGGSWSADDSADYLIVIQRAANTQPTCTPYTLQVSNNRGI